MHFILSCTVLCMLMLGILCTGEEIFIPTNVTAVPGLCALVSCSLTPENAKPIKSFLLYKCKSAESGSECTECEPISGTDWIKTLDPDLNTKICSFITKNITADDEGEYEVRVKDDQSQENTYSSRFKIIIQDEPVIEVPPLREHEPANLSCSTPSPCPQTPPHITWWIKNREGKIIKIENDTTSSTSEGFYNSTFTFKPTSELNNATVGCNANYGDDKTISTSKTIEVKDELTLRILGKDKVNEGDTLSLSCTVDSHTASSDPKWSFNETTDNLMKHISGGNLTISSVSMEHAGEYLCEVTYRNKTYNTSININVIRNTNGKSTNNTENQGTDHNANSTVLEIVKENLDLKTIITFLMGMATSAVIFLVLMCCWMCCTRAKKNKIPGIPPDSAVNLQMVQTNIDLTVTNEQTPLHNQSDAEMASTQVEMTGGAEDGEAGGAEDGEAGGAEDGEAGERAAGDVDYAAIDYSLLKNKSPEEEEIETANTDYAEIRRDGKEQSALQNEHEQTEDQKQNEEKF